MSKTCPTCLRNVNDATADPDLIPTFLGEETTDCRTARIRTSVLYSAYEKWCTDREVQPVTKTMFGRVLDECQYPAAKGTNGVRMRQGLHLKAQD